MSVRQHGVSVRGCPVWQGQNSQGHVHHGFCQDLLLSLLIRMGWGLQRPGWEGLSSQTEESVFPFVILSL